MDRKRPVRVSFDLPAATVVALASFAKTLDVSEAAVVGIVLNDFFDGLTADERRAFIQEKM